MDASAPLPQRDDALVDDPTDQVWLAIRAIRVDPPSPKASATAAVQTLRRPVDEPEAAGDEPPFCADGDFVRYFDMLGALPPTLPVLRRLVLHVDADLSAFARVALYRNLWRAVRSSPQALRQTAARLYDERHADLFGWCERPWSDPLTHRRLAQAHLPGVAAERLDWQGRPHAGFVVALLSGSTTSSDEIIEARPGAANGDEAADPERRPGRPTSATTATATTAAATTAATTAAATDLAIATADDEPTTLDPHSMLIGLQACLQAMPWGSLVDRRLADVWRQAALDVSADDPSLRRDALRTLFMLTMAQGDGEAADQALADCVREQAHRELMPAMLRRWLQADADEPSAGPLHLAPALDAKWCRPQSLHSAAFRAALASAFRRPAILARLGSLDRALADLPRPPLDLEERIPAQVLRTLSRLDAVWQRLAEHRPIGRSAVSLLNNGFVGNDAVALLQRHLALDAVAASDPHAANIALAAARAAGCHESSGLLQRMFESLDIAAWAAATDTTGHQWWHMAPAATPALGSGWPVEEPIWHQLARHGTPTIASMAAYQLAILYTDGCLQPCPGARRSAALTAHGLWTELRAEPAYEFEATRRLDSAAMRAVAAHGFQQDGLDWLCVPAAEPDADRLLIVFTGYENRHRFDSLELVNGFPGHHLLFLHDPKASGYDGEVFERLRELVQAHVGSVFDPSRVTCHGNGMGAAGALRMAMHFGFQAVVANASLHDAAAFSDAPIDTLGRAAVCLRVGARPADREAVALWLGRARRCRDARFILEKFDDEADDRDGSHLPMRVASKRGWPAALASTIDRLAQLRRLGRSDDPHGDGGEPAAIQRSHAEVPAPLLSRFWQRLNDAPRLKLEVVITDGRVFVADSLHSGTAASAP